MELSCVSPNQNRTPTWGLGEILVPKEEASKVQGELAGTCTCLKCIPKGWLVVAANYVGAKWAQEEAWSLCINKLKP
jgi:hypothetical protein